MAFSGLGNSSRTCGAAMTSVSCKDVQNSGALLLPIINLGGLDSGDRTVRARIARQVGNAMEEWGSFQVLNHGVPDELVERLQSQALGFFSLPLKSKRRANISGPNPRYHGYKGTFSHLAVPDDDETPMKESLADFHYPPFQAANLLARIWPDGNPEFSLFMECSTTLENHCNVVEALGGLLLELLAESLGLEGDFFSRHFQEGSDFVTTWRLHHFPQTAGRDRAWTTNAHSDPNIITLVKQDDGGLQVKQPGKSTWTDVLPLPGSYVINAGDTLEAWSNGRFHSVEHRILLTAHTRRFSTVNFLDVGPSMYIESPSKLIDDDHPSLFKPFFGGDFRANFERIWRLGDIRKGKALDFVRADAEI